MGMLGGSLGKALRARGLARHVVGVGRRQCGIDRAVAIGAIDEGTLRVEEGVADAELTVLATPAAEMPALVEALRGHMPQGGLLTDMGSTKANLVRTLDRLSEGRCRYVGGHPLTPVGRLGIEAASESLFDGVDVFITPTRRTDPRAMELIVGLWQGLGAQVRTVSPSEHDRLMAHACHLPLVLAAALVNATPPNAIDYIGRGYRDASRMASGDPRLWADVCLENRERLLVALERMDGEIKMVRDILVQGRRQELLAWLEGAKAVRDHHIPPERRPSEGSPT